MLITPSSVSDDTGKTTEKRQYVARNLEAVFKLWLVKAAAWGAAIFLFLSILDYVIVPELFNRFLAYRLGIASLLITIALLARRWADRPIAVHRLLAFLAIGGSAIAIELMILQFGGHRSPYYVGLIVLAVCAIGFLPAGILFHISASLVLYAVYVIPIVILDSITDGRTFFMANAFLSAVLMSALLLRYLQQQSLTNELEARYEIAGYQERLEREVVDRTARLSETLSTLAASEKKFKALFHQASDAIFLMKIEPGRGAVIVDANLAASRMHGYSAEELMGKPIAMLDDADTARHIPDRLTRLLTGAGITFEGRHVRKDGSTFPVEVSARIVEIAGEQYLIGIDRDITEHLRLVEELKRQALYDALTGLPNRLLFMDRLRNLFEHRKRLADLLFAVLFIDLDHFKKVNDSAGHTMGDQLLISSARRLVTCVRPGDTVSRFGGDEFVILLDGLNHAHDAVHTAERIQTEIQRPFDLAGKDVFITASIGIILSGPEYERPEDFVRDADTAMYHAKAHGRACHALFDPAMHVSALEVIQLENALRGAVDRKELVLHYQPILNIETGAVLGFEALVRWRHPSRGLLYPEEFIRRAEETGLISAIGEWVLREACGQLVTWQTQSSQFEPLSMSVNLSAKQFNALLAPLVRTILEETGLNPRSLKLEITENIIMANAEMAQEVLRELREMHVQVYLDDFGTGYSSLNYLHKFPVNALKIDRTFVKNILNDSEAQEIVKAIASLARNLNMGIIIEGVEEQSQLELFRSLQCHNVQGFVFTEPLDSGGTEAYMRGRLH